VIIGHGDIATALESADRKDLLFFASGVSNSREERYTEFKREIDLLRAQDPEVHTVYFSSLCIFYADSHYAFHKQQMEQIVKHRFKKYTIIRLGNITWGTNPHTIINYFRNRIKRNQRIDIKDVYRYIIDKDEFLYWITMIPDFSCEMNITGKRMLVKDIVKEYCGDLLPIYANANA
jgi:hypothetical protein